MSRDMFNFWLHYMLKLTDFAFPASNPEVYTLNESSTTSRNVNMSAPTMNYDSKQA